jgi:hypothetical protein
MARCISDDSQVTEGRKNGGGGVQVGLWAAVKAGKHGPLLGIIQRGVLRRPGIGRFWLKFVMNGR